MNIAEIYRKFPDQTDCLAYLEKIKWNGTPTCPYCKSTSSSPMKKEYRYHCNSCNTSFSVTVGTVFHKTKVDYQKWFLAILLMLNAKKRISARQLASDVQVNKNTACHMLMHIRKTMSEDPELLKGLLGADDLFRTILQRAVE